MAHCGQTQLQGGFLILDIFPFSQVSIEKFVKILTFLIAACFLYIAGHPWLMEASGRV